ncbi:MAG: hypothetical protein KGP12_05920 [Actinomycetales bacterium]|nr:hypothetical protein [Actinomycetales bacterium]
MPHTMISTPESIPPVDRLALGVCDAREGAIAAGWPVVALCSAQDEE